jgi:siroheme synthase
MGLGNIGEIVSIFKRYKPLNYPVAVISNGTLHNEKTLLSDLEQIELQVNENEIEAPAMLIFGPIVKSSIVQLKNQIHQIPAFI